MIRAAEVARQFGVTRGRVSQWVSEGKLDGCFQGGGTARRFDLAKCAAALGKKLEPGQMMGNGAETRKRISSLLNLQPADNDGDDAAADPVPTARPSQSRGSGASELGREDPDRYELARIQKAEEEARRLRRQNAQEEGTFVLASEVARDVARRMAQEIAEVDTVLREAARRIADRMGVDYKAVRLVLMETWREHRATRSEALAADAGQATMAAAERAGDI